MLQAATVIDILTAIDDSPRAMQVAKGGVAGGKFAAKFGLRSAKKAGKISKQATQQAFVEAKAGATNAVGGFKEGGVAGATQAVGGDLMKGASNVRDKAAAANHLVGGDAVTGELAGLGSLVKGGLMGSGKHASKHGKQLLHGFSNARANLSAAMSAHIGAIPPAAGTKMVMRTLAPYFELHEQDSTVLGVLEAHSLLVVLEGRLDSKGNVRSIFLPDPIVCYCTVL